MPDVWGGAAMSEILFAFCASLAVLVWSRELYPRDRPRDRRRRAPNMAGRLALPAPESEQCQRRRELLDATGRSDPTSLPDCGTGEGARWDAARVGWIRDRDGEFIPLESVKARRSR